MSSLVLSFLIHYSFVRVYPPAVLWNLISASRIPSAPCLQPQIHTVMLLLSCALCKFNCLPLHAACAVPSRDVLRAPELANLLAPDIHLCVTRELLTFDNLTSQARARAFSFYSTDGSINKHGMSSQNSPSNPMCSFSWTWTVNVRCITFPPPIPS
jgi:hypothetical protein